MHFNGLTPAEAERLAILAEECGEVIQAIGKILRHGYESRHPNGGPTNREQLEKELGDVTTIMDVMMEVNDIDFGVITARVVTKEEQLKKYTHHQWGEVWQS